MSTANLGRAFWHTVRMQGLWRALCDFAVLKLRYSTSGDRWFDRLRGTETSSAVAVPQLGIADAVARAAAVGYTPSPARITHWMIKSVPLDPAEYAFIDIGCGKGRVVLVAAEHPFRQIRGVEISSSLSQLAQQNLERSRSRRRCNDIQILCSDARSVELPEGPVLFHFYNPFSPAILRDLLERIVDTYSAPDASVWLAYLVPHYFASVIDETFARFVRFERVQFHPSLSGDFDWLIFRMVTNP
jgi:SAM-dependent methyltransferase